MRENQGNRAEAERYYRKAIESDPDNAFAFYRLARLLYHEGETQEALEMAKAALVANPVNESNKKLVQDLRKKMAEVAQPRQVRTAVQIRCVERNEHAVDHDQILSIGGVNSNGKRWKISVKEAISQIEKGKYVFYIQTAKGAQIDIIVAQTESGTRYLAARGGDDASQHLLSLPQCP